jgi:hypothetical protein
MEDGAAKPALVHQVLLLVFVGAGLIVHWRSRPGLAIGQAALWLAIGGLIFAAYSFRHEAAQILDRLAGELFPHRGVKDGGGSITFVPAREAISSSRPTSTGWPSASSWIPAPATSC